MSEKKEMVKKVKIKCDGKRQLFHFIIAQDEKLLTAGLCSECYRILIPAGEIKSV